MGRLKAVALRLREILFCAHDWEWVKNIREQNLRMGYEHSSEIFRCKKCGRCKTIEHYT